MYKDAQRLVARHRDVKKKEDGPVAPVLLDLTTSLPDVALGVVVGRLAITVSTLRLKTFRTQKSQSMCCSEESTGPGMKTLFRNTLATRALPRLQPKVSDALD